VSLSVGSKESGKLEPGMPDSNLPDSRFWDRMIPWYFVLAFLVVFAVNGVFVYLAVSTKHDLVVENAYENGVNYNEIVRDVRALKASQGDDANRP